MTADAKPKGFFERSIGDPGSYTHRALKTPVGDIASTFAKATGMRRGLWPKPLPVGWGPGALAHGAIGAGLGYAASPLISMLMPDLDPKRLRTVAMILGGLGAATPALMGLASSVGEKGWKGLGSIGDSPTKQGNVLDASNKSQEKQSFFSPPSSDMNPVAVNQSLAGIRSDPNMTPYEKAMASSTMLQANQGDPTGLMTNPGQKLMGALMGTGLGYMGASVGGKMMGALFGMQPRHQKTLRRIGAVAGLLRGAGVI